MSPAARPGPVVVVDDDAAMRDSIVFLLATEGWDSVTHPDAEDLLAAGLPRNAVCVLADIRLGPGLDGIGLLHALRERGERVPVVAITGHADVPLAVRAMRAGAQDFIEKPFEGERLLNAVAEAAEQLKPGSGSAPSHLTLAEARGWIALLSPREREVLAGLVAGHPNKVVAHQLGISTRTVEAHRAAIMTKLGLRSFAEVVRLALLAGAVEEGRPAE